MEADIYSFIRLCVGRSKHGQLYKIAIFIRTSEAIDRQPSPLQPQYTLNPRTRVDDLANRRYAMHSDRDASVLEYELYIIATHLRSKVAE
jgi:hypothetical protein